MSQLLLLIQLKLTILKNEFARLRSRSKVELFTLIIFFLGAGGGLFLFFFHSFRFFMRQEPFGPILVVETFYLFNLTLFVMLLISSGVSAYTSLFRSPEVRFLISCPIQWPNVYWVKLTEALWFSSWSFIFITVPFMIAYGLNQNVAWGLFPFFGLIFYILFVILTATLGTLLAILCVWFLPSRTRRHIALGVIILISVLMFLRAQPEVVKEQGSIMGIMSGYLPHVAFAKNPILPSYWTTRGILALTEVPKVIGWREGFFYLLVLLANTLFFFIPSFSAAGRLYPYIFLRAQDYGESEEGYRVKRHPFLEKLLDILPWPSRPARAFLEKDIKTFLRDPAEWSQLIIFFGILSIYFLNLKNLEFHVLKPFWKNIVFVLNTVGTYIVLSSFNMRFVFPMLSMEGNKSWIIGLAPIRFSSLLLVKFLIGVFFSMALSMPLVFLSGWMLEISTERIWYTTGLGLFVCVALTGLSVGLGARFPNFKSNNPSEIISGFGGSVLLMTHLCYLSVIGTFLMLSRESHHIIFWTMAAASLLIGAIPLKIGVSALKKFEF